jgi:hypothetical protein
MQPRLACNFRSFCLSLQSAGITGVHHHAWLITPIFRWQSQGSERLSSWFQVGKTTLFQAFATY